MRRAVGGMGAGFLVVVLAIDSLAWTRPKAHADAPGEGVWVAVEFESTNRGGAYYGQIDQKAFDELVAGEARGFVKLRKVFFIDDSGAGHRHEDAPGFSDVTHLRAERIIRISPVRADFCEKVRDR